MPAMEPIGGSVQFKTGSEMQNAKGEWTYFPEYFKKTVVSGAGLHGVTEEYMPGFIEGVISDRAGLKLSDLINATRVVLNLRNGKVIDGQSVAFTGDPSVTTTAGEIKVRFEGKVVEVR